MDGTTATGMLSVASSRSSTPGIVSPVSSASITADLRPFASRRRRDGSSTRASPAVDGGGRLALRGEQMLLIVAHIDARQGLRGKRVAGGLGEPGGKQPEVGAIRPSRLLALRLAGEVGEERRDIGGLLDALVGSHRCGHHKGSEHYRTSESALSRRFRHTGHSWSSADEVRE